MSPVANSIKQTVLNSHDKAIQRKTKMFFSGNEGEKELIPAKAIHLRGEIPKLSPLCFNFFSFPPSLFLCLLSKTTWANIASCHIKAIPCILQRGEFCSWMERQSSQTPNHRLHTWGVKTEEGKKRLFLFEPEFVPWGQTHYSTAKEVFHAITEQIDMDEMLGVVGDLNSNLLSYLKTM